MKLLNKLLFGFFSFFIIFLNISAEENIKFSCDYSYGDIKFRIKVDIDKEYVKNIRETKNESKNEIEEYFKVFTIQDGEYKQVKVNNWGTKAYDAYDKYKKLIYFFENTNRRVSYKIYLENAFSSTTNVTCPDMYLDQTKDDFGNIIVDGYMFVPNSKWSADTTSGLPTSADNIKVTSEGTNCYDENDNIISNCDLKEHTNVRNDDNKLECDYSANGGNVFRITYYKEEKKASFHPVGCNISLNKNFKLGEKDSSGYEYINSNALLDKFSNATSCPKRIECNCSSWGGCDIYSDNPNKNCGFLKNDNGKKIDDYSSYTPDDINLDISDKDMNCAQILGPNLTSLVKLCVTIARIVGAVITLIMGMASMIPAISSGDQGALNKAFKKCITLAIILVIICLLPTFLKLIGDIAGFDLTCFF